MTSKELKKTLAAHLYWHLKYPIVCDEFEFIDIIGVRRTRYVVEFEIKVSKSDLDREIKCIIADPEKTEKYGKDWEKVCKHKTYLTGERPKTNYDLRLNALGIGDSMIGGAFRPNEFYFYVPDYLADYAIKRMAELNLPYGVVKQVNEYPHYVVMRKAVKLHNEKATPSLYYKLAHALTIRSRLFN